MLKLAVCKRTHPPLLLEMDRHYSKPRGFVGRNICYSVFYDCYCYGHIVGGSATRFLPGREEFLKFPCLEHLNQIINNIFFHVEPKDGKYPVRNFTTKVIKEFEKVVVNDWKIKYGDTAWALETLVEIPRTGELYLRAGWTEVGITKGYTCKRGPGKGTDKWTGARIWDTENLRPKRVLVKSLIT